MYGIHLWLPKAHVEASGGINNFGGCIIKVGRGGGEGNYSPIKWVKKENHSAFWSKLVERNGCEPCVFSSVGFKTFSGLLICVSYEVSYLGLTGEQGAMKP